MKKYLVFGLVFVIVLSGCTGEERDEDLLECDKIQDQYEKYWCYYDSKMSATDILV